MAIRRFNVFVSEIVIEEAGLGDQEAARRRLEELKHFPHLELNDKSVHNIDYLVTWNCAHLAHGEVIKKLMKINESFGIHTPIICTPEELMEV
jgi:hypothetical protein